MALGLVVALLAVTMPATAIAPISESSYAETRLWTFEHQDPAGSRAERGLSRTGIEGYQLSSWKPRRAVPFTRGGQQVALHNYFPFGQEATSAEADEIQLKFTGHERDKTGTGARSELDYMHARYCSPVLGRFLSVDPARSAKVSAPGSWNRYTYGANNPINEIDSNGRESRAAMALEQDIQRLMRGEITQEQYIENINARGMGALFAVSLLSPVDETTLVVAATRKALPNVGSKLSAVFARLGKVFQRGSRGVPRGAARFPSKPGQIKHIFRDAPGHLADTPANRKLLQGVADDASTALGTDKFGNVWSARTLDDGTQVWVQSRNGVIKNGGLNQTPRIFDSTTGLSGQ